jgi:hypothetical protein
MIEIQLLDSDVAHYLTDETAPAGVVVGAHRLIAGDTVRLSDGRHGYVDEVAGEWGVFGEVTVVDHGGNEYAARVAPASLVGINPGGHRGAVPTRTVSRRLLAWLVSS